MKVIEEMLEPLTKDYLLNDNFAIVSFQQFMQFMFTNRFSRGVEDDELLALIFALLLNKKDNETDIRP